MALVFPASPSVGQRYPVNPGTSGVSQWVWDGSSWNIVPSLVSLGAANQSASNSYVWPSADGTSGQTIATNGSGTLAWQSATAPTFQALSVTPAFDGATLTFGIVEYGGSTTYTPSPSSNILVFLDGVIQPVTNYLVSGSTINFSTAPATGVVFYAVSAKAV